MFFERGNLGKTTTHIVALNHQEKVIMTKEDWLIMGMRLGCGFVKPQLFVLANIRLKLLIHSQILRLHFLLKLSLS